jgi:hypothetical protein
MEPTLVAEERAASAVARFREKFHPHHDYLTLIVPSAWLMFWVVLLDFCFYQHRHIRAVLSNVSDLRNYFAEMGTGLEFFLALFLFLIVFTLFYAGGQLINGVSALILDRLIVKKLLKYPFDLYLRRLKAPKRRNDHDVFRDAVLESSYLVFCLNLIPFVALEGVLILFSIVEKAEFHAALVSYSGSSPLLYDVIVGAIVVFLVYIHFGRPSRARVRRYCGKAAFSDSQLKSLWWSHCLLVLSLSGLEMLLVLQNCVGGILLLPLLNVVIGIHDRSARKRAEDKQVIKYLRACFANPIYFAANIVGYGDFPSESLIRMVRDEFIAEDKDFFWMTYLAVQNRNEGSSQTVYHFLAMYGMVRNLCNATAFAIVLSVGFFSLGWPTGQGPMVIAWTAILCALMYALFARYLYVYGPYFAKYVLRAAAYSRASRRTYLRSSHRSAR